MSEAVNEQEGAAPVADQDAPPMSSRNVSNATVVSPSNVDAVAVEEAPADESIPNEIPSAEEAPGPRMPLD